MNPRTVGILLYGKDAKTRDASSEDKYRLLVEKFRERGWRVETLSYHQSRRDTLQRECRQCQAVLVWINPIEPQLDRAALDTFLRDLASEGVFVSAHPDMILQIGTKDVLVATQSLGWSVDVTSYRTLAEFREGFPAQVHRDGARVLKQYRGQSGQGVWKVTAPSALIFHVQPASGDEVPGELSLEEMAAYFDAAVFSRGSHLVDQRWVATMDRGMVRAYVCGMRVVGFGYQEIVALHPSAPDDDFTRQQPSRRHYYTQDCYLFRNLRQQLETEWIPALVSSLALDPEGLPLLWDADFFLGDPAGSEFLLCEINASCVSPFPESAITPLIDELERRLAATK